MSKLFKFFFIIILCVNLFNCSEKISYSGKIINEDFQNYTILSTKNLVLEELGKPTFVDIVENKYFYYSETIKYKNIFNRKIDKRKILVFSFNQNNSVSKFESYDLDNEKNIKFVKQTTDNNLIEKGLMEKIFGGVGKGYVPNTTQN